MLLLYFPLPLFGQRLTPPREYHSDDEYHSKNDEEETETSTMGNICNIKNYFILISTCDFSLAGSYLGEPCVDTCSSTLHHVYCNPTRKVCECEKNYPVKLDRRNGCTNRKLISFKFDVI